VCSPFVTASLVESIFASAVESFPSSSFARQSIAPSCLLLLIFLCSFSCAYKFRACSAWICTRIKKWETEYSPRTKKSKKQRAPTSPLENSARLNQKRTTCTSLLYTFVQYKGSNSLLTCTIRVSNQGLSCLMGINRIQAKSVFGGARIYFSLAKQRVNFLQID
jgi:hypothetical protein